MVRVIVFNATFNNISVISWRSVLYLYTNVIKSVNTVRPQHTRVYVAICIKSVSPIKNEI